MARTLIEEMVSQFGNRKGDKQIFRETISGGINRSRTLEFLAGNILDIAMTDLVNYGRIYSTEEMHQFRKEITFQEIVDYISKELSPEKLYWWVLMP